MRGHQFWAVGAGAIALLLAVTPVVANVFDPRPPGPVLRNVYLHDASLSDVTLQGGFLDAMTLARVHVHDAALRNSTVTDALLVGADLEGTHLLRSTVQGFLMVGGSATDATLERGRVRDASLTRVRLCEVYVEETRTYYGRDCAPLRALPGEARAPERQYDRDPIRIASDSDLCDNVSLYKADDGTLDGVDDDGVINCLTASGTPDRPFRISGWRITTAGTAATAAVHLQGLHAHVALDNLHLTAPGTVGLRLAASRNLVVAPDVLIEEAAVGIDLQNVHLSRVSGDVRSATDGLRATASAGLTIEHLQVEGSGVCVDVAGTAADLRDVTAVGCATAFRLMGGPVTLAASRTYRVETALRLTDPEPGTLVAHNRFLTLAEPAIVAGTDGFTAVRDNLVAAST